MADKKINIDVLYSKQDEMFNLIRDTYSYLNLNEPTFDRYVKRAKSAIEGKSVWLGAQLTKAVQSKDIRKLLIGGAIYGTALAGVTVAEFVGDKIEYEQAKRRLLPYFQELVSKQSLIQKEHILTIQKKEEIISLLQINAAEYEKKIQELEEKQILLTNLLTRFDDLQNLVVQ